MHDFVVRVRPKRSLSLTGSAAFFVLTIPVFAVLYWYTASSGTWNYTLALHLIVLLLFALTLARQSRVFTAVSQVELMGNGIFSPLKQVPLHRIRSVALAPVYGRDSSETSIQFTVLDKDGQCLFRMRGEFWHDHDLYATAEALGVIQLTGIPAMTRQDYFVRYPGSRYWFERST
jgi:hypothetical protein